MVKFNYDYKWDMLYIYREEEKVKFSVEAIDNFVIDIGFNGKVVGLEIQNASRVLKISKKELKEIKAAKLATLIKGDVYGVLSSLQLRSMNLESELRIPVKVKMK